VSAALKLGFVPLNDAASLIAAADKGFFAAEGLKVELSREASWATVRDKLAVGALDGAHMLAPMVLAATLGAGSDSVPMIAPLALNLNGPAVTLATSLVRALGDGPPAEGLARLISLRREQDATPLTFAVVFPYSAHNYVLRAWLAGVGVDPDLDVRITVAPPPRMADLLAGGVIEGFCVGEPWGAAAVMAGVGRTIVHAAEVSPATPDKVFGVTEAWAAARPQVLQALVRALLRAAAWTEASENRDALVALLAKPDRLGASPELVAAGLAAADFPRDGAGPPRPEQAVWLLDQMARWRQVPGDLDHAAVAARVYRPDLYQAAATALDA
jgi:ABC-type nitrate/sulfonate/bicarbonate transport system substrate-binding protein